MNKQSPGTGDRGSGSTDKDRQREIYKKEGDIARDRESRSPKEKK
jgi:hypothetical protein